MKLDSDTILTLICINIIDSKNYNCQVCFFFLVILYLYAFEQMTTSLIMLSKKISFFLLWSVEKKWSDSYAIHVRYWFRQHIRQLLVFSNINSDIHRMSTHKMSDYLSVLPVELIEKILDHISIIDILVFHSISIV